MSGKNKNKILLILIVVLVVACALYLGVSSYTKNREAKRESEAAAESEASRIWVTEMADVAAVEVAGGETAISFVKEDDVWYDGEDRDFPVDQDKLNSLADTAGKLEATRAITEADALADYGLEAPQVRVTVMDSGGSAAVLLIGNSYNGEYYLKREDADTVYTVGSALADAVIGKALYDFVAVESLPAITADKIQTMEVITDGVSHRLERNTKSDESDSNASAASDGEITETEAIEAETSETEAAEAETSETDVAETWTYLIDGEAQASDGGIGLQLASALAGMSISGCVDYRAADDELAGYGLDEPTVRITYSFEGDDGIGEVTVNVGTLTEDSASYHVMTGGSTAVNLISAESIDGILGYVNQKE